MQTHNYTYDDYINFKAQVKQLKSMIKDHSRQIKQLSPDDPTFHDMRAVYQQMMSERDKAK